MSIDAPLAHTFRVRPGQENARLKAGEDIHIKWTATSGNVSGAWLMSMMVMVVDDDWDRSRLPPTTLRGLGKVQVSTGDDFFDFGSCQSEWELCKLLVSRIERTSLSRVASVFHVDFASVDVRKNSPPKFRDDFSHTFESSSPF